MEKQFVLKAKTAVKRVAAISAGATMMGATMMGAVAADLGDYPTPFVADGELNGMVVVGSASSAGDIVGAGDLISTLTQATVSASGSTTSTEGGEDFEVAFDTTFSASNYDDEDIAGLIDGEVEFDDETYDVHEEIRVGTGMKLLISGADNEEDFGTTVYLGTDDASNEQFGYRYVFDSNTSAITSGISSNDTLTIDFLGSTIELTALDTTDEITFNLADEVSLFAGESTTVNGKTVTLKNVATNKVVVDVDGVQETVGQSAETVNGIKVKVHETFDSDNLADRFAVLLVGDDITQSVDDEDIFEMFGLTDDADENPWEWDIAVSENATHIGVSYVYTSDDSGDDFPPYALGESLTLPNDFGAIVLDSLTNDDYTRVTFDFGQSRNIGGTPQDVITVSADRDDAFLMEDTEEVDTFYIYEGADNATGLIVAYKDSDGDWNTATLADSDGSTVNSTANIAELVYGDGAADDVDFTVTALDIGVGHEIQLPGISSDMPSLNFNTSIVSSEFVLGTAEDDETSNEILMGTTDVSSRDFDNLFADGIIIYDPEQNADGAGKIVIDYPAEAVDGNVIVTGPGSVTTSLVYSSVTVNSVAGQSVIKLDTEVTDPASRNLILVGGPAVNRLTAQAMGLNYPTTGAESGIPEGAALIRLVENAFGGSNSALVVAGWEAEDTRAATSVLQNYRSYANSLNGRMEVQVSGTSVTAVGGDVATE